MTSASWQNNADGNWAIASNWSTGVVPGASTDVTINTSSLHTVTHSINTDSIASLYIYNDILAMTGGSLSVLGTADITGAVTQSAGTLRFAGLNAEIDGTLTQTAGIINIASGSLKLEGTGNSLGGTVSGGTINFAYGSDTLASKLSLTAGQVIISDAQVTLGNLLNYSGIWTQTGGTLALGGHTLETTGAVNLDGGVINGAGTISLTKATEISGIYVEGSAVINNTGSITQTSSWYLGYNSTDTAKLNNEAGATFTIANNADIYGSAVAAFTNAGTLNKLGAADSDIQVAVTSTGTIAIAGGELVLEGPSNSLGGTISGAGELELYSGSDTFKSGLSLTVARTVLANSANLSLTSNLSYGGIWTQTGGTLALGGYTLTSTGTVNLDGGAINGSGTLTVAKGEISGFYLEGSAVLRDAGSITETGSWYLGYNSTDTARMVNQYGATFTIANNADIYGSASASLTNAGTLSKQGGADSSIQVATTSTGTMTIAGGYLTLEGPSNTLGGIITGAGGLELYAGSDTFSSGLNLSVARVLLDNGANLTLAAGLSYGGIWTQTGGTLALGGYTLTSKGTVNLDGGVLNGSGTLAITKSAEITGFYQEGSVKLTNTGSITQTGSWYLGYNSTDTAEMENLAGGSFIIASNADIYGSAVASFINAGTLTKQAGATSQINVALTSTGTIAVNGGDLVLAGPSNTLGGIVSGAGVLELYAGSDTFSSGLSLTVSDVLLANSANLSLTSNLSYAGVWSQTDGTLGLGGKTLTSTGTVNLDGGVINGSGTVAITKAAEISHFYLEGSAAINNTGSITQTGYWYLGYNSSDTARLTNQAGASYTIAANADIYGSAGASFINSGSLIKQAGEDSEIHVSLTSTGTISVGSGDLTLGGPSNSLGGTIGGTGELELYAGSDTFQSGLSLTVGSVLLDNSANLTLGANLSYAGTWSQTNGTLALGGHTLTATGMVNLDGGVINGSGELTIGKAGELSGLYLEGSAILRNAGTLTQSGNWDLGYNSTDTASMVNQYGATFTLTNNSDIYGSSAASLTNAGTMIKQGGGESDVDVATINSGSLQIASGELVFMSTVSGTGSFKVAAGATVEFRGAVASGGSVSLSAYSDLYVQAAAGFHDKILGFAAGNAIEMTGFGFSGSTLTFDATTDELTIHNGSSTSTLLFSGSYSASDFRLFSDGGTAAIAHS